MNTEQILSLALKHLGSGSMVSSAQLCLDDAIALAAEGKDAQAQRRALRSLAYSVGIGHPDFVRVNAHCER